jgi:hypothetical protein
MMALAAKAHLQEGQLRRLIVIIYDYYYCYHHHHRPDKVVIHPITQTAQNIKQDK